MEKGNGLGPQRVQRAMDAGESGGGVARRIQLSPKVDRALARGMESAGRGVVSWQWPASAAEAGWRRAHRSRVGAQDCQLTLENDLLPRCGLHSCGHNHEVINPKNKALHVFRHTHASLLLLPEPHRKLCKRSRLSRSGWPCTKTHVLIRPKSLQVGPPFSVSYRSPPPDHLVHPNPRHSAQ